jgi:hypothetical protein
MLIPMQRAMEAAHGCIAQGCSRVPGATQLPCPGRDAARSDAAQIRDPRVGYISSRASSNGSSPAARRFFFERCQTTPGKPFSGTSGSPV